MQHSHSRHQETTWNLFKINLKGILKFSDEQPLEGAMCMNLRWNSRGHPKNISECSWFQIKQFTRLLEFIKLYKQNSLENVFIFPIYQNYIFNLALTHGRMLTFQYQPKTSKQNNTFFFFYTKRVMKLQKDSRKLWTERGMHMQYDNSKYFYYYCRKRKWMYITTTNKNE